MFGKQGDEQLENEQQQHDHQTEKTTQYQDQQLNQHKNQIKLIDKDIYLGEEQENHSFLPPIKKTNNNMQNKQKRQSGKQQKLRLLNQSIQVFDNRTKIQEKVDIKSKEIQPQQDTAQHIQQKQSKEAKEQQKAHSQFVANTANNTKQPISITSAQSSLIPQPVFSRPLFNPLASSSSITLTPTSACQSLPYYLNSKLALTTPISPPVSCKFRLDSIQYCIGVGIALLQIIQSHQYNYKSQGENQMQHGLYLITTQGYSWSHSEKEDDDTWRDGWKEIYPGVQVEVNVEKGEKGSRVGFKWKRGQFSMGLPESIWQKYRVCFCVYLHEKGDQVSICQ